MKMLEHLKSRHMEVERYSAYYDEEVCTFLLFDLSGRVTGYQSYRPNSTKHFRNDEYGRYIRILPETKEKNCFRFSDWKPFTIVLMFFSLQKVSLELSLFSCCLIADIGIMTQMIGKFMKIEGEIVEEIVRFGHKFQIEKLSTPKLIGKYERFFDCGWMTTLLWGQWHYTLESARRRAFYCIEADYERRIAYLELTVNNLERKLVECGYYDHNGRT